MSDRPDSPQVTTVGDLRLVRDSSGYIAAEGAGVPDILADFLRTDIGPGPDYAARLAAGFAQPDAPFECFGNIYHAHAAGDRVWIENMHDAAVPPLVLDRGAFVAVLRRWHAAVSGVPTSPDGTV